MSLLLRSIHFPRSDAMFEVVQPCGEPQRLERRAPSCRECGGSRFRRFEWIEEVREVFGFGGGDLLERDGASRDLPAVASFGEHLWCEACGTSCELPLEVEYH
jgi:hypothetical protein